ncbi:uncharacterized protein AB675_7291 [Cyphellophora attinorum]|uniref:Uncharacterized protein n=1 Tax=Cyphellophora attinorum TaxID=1664694 RepID=A0A0N0NIY0_9EURO|nr:uncharacterized protein AB675_7291 [Phialophora attinorum]KPI36268.1 hypothetical protein AB675_7291 [Phialophora attinorum]
MSSGDPPQSDGRGPAAASQEVLQETSGSGRNTASFHLTPGPHQANLPITATFRFMDMVVDIREIIYGLIFRDMMLRRGSIPPISMSIIFASKACYAEARPILLSEATFHVRPTGGGEPYLNASNLPLALKDYSTLRHIQVSMPDQGSRPQFVHRLLTSLPNLRSVDCHFISYSGPSFMPEGQYGELGVQIQKDRTIDEANLERVKDVLASTIPHCLARQPHKTPLENDRTLYEANRLRVEVTLNTGNTVVKRIEDPVDIAMEHYPPCGPEHKFVLAETVVEDLLASVVAEPLDH